LYAGTGQVRFEYKHLAFIGEESIRAAEAAECASEQGAFWAYHDTLFLNQGGENVGQYSEPNLIQFGEELGLNVEEFQGCLRDGRMRQEVRDESAEAGERGVTSTPTIFINGEIYRGALPFDQLQGIIESILAGR
jgi:protein-disulfide isomerase